jgi:hypothetical protein
MSGDGFSVDCQQNFKKGTNRRGERHSPPVEGWRAKRDGVVTPNASRSDAFSIRRFTQIFKTFLSADYADYADFR